MKHDEFIQHVQSLAQVELRDEAEKATHATLKTLAECVREDEAKKLADQLPDTLALDLRESEGPREQSLSLQEFYQRVSQREGIEPVAAVMHVRAVFAVLNAAVTPAEFGHIREQLSEDYEELFASPDQRRMNPSSV